MSKSRPLRALSAPRGRVLKVTPVFDTYWRFAAARQAILTKRLAGAPPPWTEDPILARHRFTNAYRASDRVSQYLMRNVIYVGLQTPEEVFFRTLLFKIFNKVETWELLVSTLGHVPTWRTFDLEYFASVLDAAIGRGLRIYSAAYIMPSPAYGHPRKHRNHLHLLEQMMRERTPEKVARARGLDDVFVLLRSFPSLGDFLAFQFAIDLNYSSVVNFSEMDFVVAGPGAKAGIRKCFSDLGGLTEQEVIALCASIADEEFSRLGLEFRKLGGVRPLQLIDCQNLFCETDKYARVAHPEFNDEGGRTRIKQVYVPHSSNVDEFYPEKWNIPRIVQRKNSRVGGATSAVLHTQAAFAFTDD